MAEFFTTGLSKGRFKAKGWIAQALLCGAVGLVIAYPAATQEVSSDWWFDIEFIAFKRDLLPGHPEDFSQTDYQFSEESPFDLMTLDLLQQANPTFRVAASLPDCDLTKRPMTLDDLTISAFDTEQLLTDANQYATVSFVDHTTRPPLDIQTRAFIEQQHWLTDAPSAVKLSCVSELTYAPFNHVPQLYFADSPYHFGNHAVLADEATFLSAYAKRLFAQRDVTPLLYTAWRQPVVFGEDNAAFYRIYAGKKINIETPPLAQLASQDTIEKPDYDNSESIIRQLRELESVLASPQAIEWKMSLVDKPQAPSSQIDMTQNWELDGLFKVYLDNVNRIPYLHIDSEFKHFRLDVDASGQSVITSYPSKQRRRIISKQIHYFDHPAFGIIVRLERYQVPPVDQAP